MELFFRLKKIFFLDFVPKSFPLPKKAGITWVCISVKWQDRGCLLLATAARGLSCFQFLFPFRLRRSDYFFFWMDASKNILNIPNVLQRHHFKLHKSFISNLLLLAFSLSRVPPSGGNIAAWDIFASLSFSFLHTILWNSSSHYHPRFPYSLIFRQTGSQELFVRLLFLHKTSSRKFRNSYKT